MINQILLINKKNASLTKCFYQNIDIKNINKLKKDIIEYLKLKKNQNSKIKNSLRDKTS